ncbi:hypothetical protein DFH07DRAFT_767675 [Mycena maculata]|uniref:Uncharacterized protein n=1 Tax=Mycena maculata TaxID=230809 RepID=A0AAD7JZG7_9AGAR|nr:hypothetical protein DFH07DRAFT_767675 [Mycena maculata]
MFPVQMLLPVLDLRWLVCWGVRIPLSLVLIWGLTISGTILVDQLTRRLAAARRVHRAHPRRRGRRSVGAVQPAADAVLHFEMVPVPVVQVDVGGMNSVRYEYMYIQCGLIERCEARLIHFRDRVKSPEVCGAFCLAPRSIAGRSNIRILRPRPIALRYGDEIVDRRRRGMCVAIVKACMETESRCGRRGKVWCPTRGTDASVELKELPCWHHLDWKGNDLCGEDAAWLERKDVPM